MDKSGMPGYCFPMLFDEIFPETLSLTLSANPYVQSQDDSWSIKGFVFPDWDLFICLGGSAVFSIDSEEFILEKGMAFLAPPLKRIDARKLPGENFQAIAQHFNLKHIIKNDFFGMFSYRPCIRFADWDFMSQLAGAYARGFAEDRPGERLNNHALFRTIILQFAREAWIEDRENEDPQYGFVFRMAREIEAGQRDPSIVGAVLRGAPFSEDYAKRLFRKQFGISPARYLVDCRMRTAIDHLMSGSTVKAASRAAGFEDELYFSRVFSKQQGMSPRAWQTSQGLK